MHCRQAAWAWRFSWKSVKKLKPIERVGAVTVRLREGESFDSLLRRFNKEVMDGGVLKDLRRRRWFVPKGEQRRMDERKGRRRARIQRLRADQGED